MEVERPPNVFGTPLASGATLWSWVPGPKDRKKNCPLKYRALGADPVEAFRIARELNADLRDWRAGVKVEACTPGTFGWLMDKFLNHKDVLVLSDSARMEYARHAGYMNALTQKGAPIERKMLATFTVLFAYNFYNKLVEKHGIGIANRCLTQARYAWNKIYVLHERMVPEINPFDKIEAGHREVVETLPATYAELESFISAALAMNEIGIAIGARLTWDMHIRPTEVFGSVTAEHWRPERMPHHIWVGADKTSKGKRKKASTWQALDAQDEDGAWVSLFPELDSLVRMRPYAGGHICMRERRVGTRVFKGDWREIRNADKVARKIREKACLPDHVTLEGFRHGGLTELGDAGIPDTLAQARSLHRQRATLDRYIHRTNDQAVAAQRMRLAYRKET